jgi:hypothetical protein
VLFGLLVLVLDVENLPKDVVVSGFHYLVVIAVWDFLLQELGHLLDAL